MQEKASAAQARAAGPSSAGGSMFTIREDGKNGTVEIAEGRIIRTRKKTMGKDDIQTIPVKAITAVSHDRKTRWHRLSTATPATRLEAARVGDHPPVVGLPRF